MQIDINSPSNDFSANQLIMEIAKMQKKNIADLMNIADLIPMSIKYPKDIKAWRSNMGLTAKKAAILLGVSQRTYWNYERGESRIPHHIGLACEYLKLFKSKLDSLGILRGSPSSGSDSSSIRIG